jgi:hypothetical protein
MTGIDPYSLGAGVLEGIAGAVEANQTRQRKKGIINNAYRLGKARLDLTQMDTRESQAEGLLSRGLGQRGSINTKQNPVRPAYNPQAEPLKAPGYVAAPAAPAGAPTPAGARTAQDRNAWALDMSRAHDLGEQQTTDLRREQFLESNALLAERNAALSDVNAEATQGMIGAAGKGIAAGFQLNESVNEAKATPTPGLASVTGLKGAQYMGPAPDTPYSNAFGGIDPVHPLERGAWAQSGNDTFNKFAERG